MNRTINSTKLLSCLCLSTLVCTAASLAVALNPGDILVVDNDAFGGAGGVIRVDPATGAQTAIASGGNFYNPCGIAVQPDGNLLVTDTSGKIIKIDPATGAQTVIASGGNLVEPCGILIQDNGNLLVSDTAAPDGTGAIIRVNPANGTETVISSAGYFQHPYRLVLDGGGDILVADSDALAGNKGAIIKVDPVTGAQTIVSSDGSFSEPTGIVLEPDGNIVVTDGETAAILRINPATGEQSLVSSGGSLYKPIDIVRDSNGDFIVVDGPRLGAGIPKLIKVNPVTGAQTIISSSGLFSSFPVGVAIFEGTDADGDGINDAADQCPNTPPGEIVNGAGCSIAQLAPCAGPWRNHGKYVSAVAKVAAQFLADGLVTAEQKDVVVSEAAKSNCGSKN